MRKTQSSGMSGSTSTGMGATINGQCEHSRLLLPVRERSRLGTTSQIGQLRTQPRRVGLTSVNDVTFPVPRQLEAEFAAAFLFQACLGEFTRGQVTSEPCGRR